MQGLEIIESETELSIVGRLYLKHITDSLWYSYTKASEALSASIAFEIREVMIPLHRRIFGQNYLTGFIKSCLSETRALVGENSIIDLKFEPGRLSMRITIDVLSAKAELISKISVTRPCPIIDIPDHKFDQIDGEEEEAEKQLISREVYETRKLHARKILRLHKLTVTDVANAIGVTPRRCHAMLARPFKEGKPTPKHFKEYYDYLLKIEAQVPETN